jgi:hypothetical protein
VLSPFQSMWSKSFLIWFISNQTVPFPHHGGVCLTFSIFFKNFFSYTLKFLLSVIFITRCWHVHLHQQNTYGLCLYLKRNDPVIMHSLRNNTSNMHNYLLSLFHPFHPRNNTLYYHHIYFTLSLPPHFPDT